MFKDIIIGQYIPGKTLIHRLDPRLKLILTFVYIICLFMANTPWGYLAVTALTLIMTLGCRVPIKFILKGLRPMLVILIFTAVFNVFLVPGEQLIGFQIGWLSLGITKEGLVAAGVMMLRLLYLVTGTSVLTLTTTPLQLTAAIESLLSPLDRFKVPSHEIAMMMSIALRFIPTLADETEKIMKAQTARGADFESGNLIRRAKALIPLLVPLFVSAFRRADELAVAMEARCYNSGHKRTRMKQMRVSRTDVVTAVIYTAVCAGIALL